MKATGIVRRIDDLGRVVIPKEIRRTLRIREGDPLEIYTDREGEVILKKYSPINDLGEFAREYVETLYETLGTPAFVTDRDEVIAVAGIGKKEYINRRITSFAEGFMEERSTKIEKMDTSIEIVPGQYEQVKSYCASPIMVNGDPIGCIIVLSKVHFVGEVEVKVVETAASYCDDLLGRVITFFAYINMGQIRNSIVAWRVKLFRYAILLALLRRKEGNLCRNVLV